MCQQIHLLWVIYVTEKNVYDVPMQDQKLQKEHWVSQRNFSRQLQEEPHLILDQSEFLLVYNVKSEAVTRNAQAVFRYLAMYSQTGPEWNVWPSQFGNSCGICNRQGRADIEKEEGEGPRNPEQKLGVLILGLRWNIFYLKMCQGQALFGRKYLRKWEALNEINVSQRRKKE